MHTIGPMGLRNLILFTRDSSLASIVNISQLAQSHQLNLFLINPFEISIEDSSFQALLEEQNFEETIVLNRCSGITFDDHDLNLCDFLVDKGCFCPHRISSLRILRDKDQQYLFLKKKDYPMVKTFIHRGLLTEEKLRNFDLTTEQELESKLWIVKSIRGNKGIGILRLTTKELLSFWEKAVAQRDQRFLIQPFLGKEPHSHEGAREIRILNLGVRNLAVEKEQGSHWKKNAQFSSFKEASIKKSERNQLFHLSDKIKDDLSLPHMAVDFIWNSLNQRWEILEVNTHPGLEASSEALGTSLYPLYWNSILPPT